MKRLNVYDVKFTAIFPDGGPVEGFSVFQEQVIANNDAEIIQKLQKSRPGARITILEKKLSGAQG